MVRMMSAERTSLRKPGKANSARRLRQGRVVGVEADTSSSRPGRADGF
jgi:hypothetical protein